MNRIDSKKKHPPKPSEVLRDMQNAGTLTCKFQYKELPEFVKSTLFANEQIPYVVFEEEDGEGE